MNKLPNDICRCAGAGCKQKEQCLRHTDIPSDEEAQYPMSHRLCDGFYIYFIKNSNEKTT